MVFHYVATALVLLCFEQIGHQQRRAVVLPSCGVFFGHLRKINSSESSASNDHLLYVDLSDDRSAWCQ